MNAIITLSRVLVGSLFIISGLIKANDALGFSYKLVEYFGEKALNLPFLEPYALGLAVFICIGEIVLGLAVLIGGRAKLTAALLMVMILFFTWLTFYTATCDPYEQVSKIVDGVEVLETRECVLECGCFGNAIPLTPWESFYKDLALLVFITIIFIAAFFSDRIKLNSNKEDLIILPASLLLLALFSILMLDWWFPILFAMILFAAYLGIKRFNGSVSGEWMIAGAAVVICAVFQYYTLAHLPIKDYRPYAEGKSVRDGMKSAEELGLDPPVFAVQYLFTNTQTGKDTTVLSTDYLEKKLYSDETFKKLYENKSWDGETIKLKDGYQPPISDFALEDFYGEDQTEAVLNDQGYSLLYISYDVTKAAKGSESQLAELSRKASETGVAVYGVSSSNMEEIESYRFDHQLAFPFFIADEKVLKTVVRANPGLVLLKDGMVVKKWHNNDFPDFAELQKNYLN